MGDMIMINSSLVTEDYNTVRLKYIPADKYADENPLLLPGFTAGFSLMAMLGAALLLRRD
jgi:PGF-CTERM protein